jgi:ammonia channel protein AmtB
MLPDHRLVTILWVFVGYGMIFGGSGAPPRRTS